MQEHLADLLTTNGLTAFAVTVTLLISLIRTAFPITAKFDEIGRAHV